MDTEFKKPMDYFETRKYINFLAQKYPFLKVKKIGTSCAGRDIFCLILGDTDEYALFAGAFHGSEYITSALLLKYIGKLCFAISEHKSIASLNIEKAFTGRSLAVIPLVNPDGCEISINGKLGAFPFETQIKRMCKGDYKHWNANLRGVDINHNFNAGWCEQRKNEHKNGIYGPSMSKFGGYSPESEPETKALTEFCRANKIRHIVAVHSQGEVIYWQYGKNKPARSEKMAEILSASSGYSLETQSGTAIAGGFKDWFIDEFNRPGFTVEVGKGENPLPFDNLIDIYRTTEEMFTLAAIM